MKYGVLCSMICGCFLLGVVAAQAESGSLTGTVRDSKTGDALIGARVTLFAEDASLEDLLGLGETQIGGIVVPPGKFTIKNLKAGKYLLQVNYVGYKVFANNVQVTSGKESSLAIELIPDVRGLDEVVVTGVASRTQKSVAEVAVGRINAADYTKQNVYTDVSQLLTNKVPGVTITQAAGQVGSGLRFNVRSGAGLLGGQPVVFVDGVRINSANFAGFASGGQEVSALANLNPDDIQNIEVLKGPAASALYGTSGQNGVILITTKRGKQKAGEQDEVRINFQGIVGFNDPHTKYTEDMALTYEDVNNVFRTGDVRQYGISAEGSSGIFNYYVGYEDRDEKGIVLQNELKRQSARLNLEAVTSKNFTLRASGNYVSSTITRPQNDNNIFGWLGNTLLFGPQVGSYAFTDSAAIAAFENSVETNRFIGSIEANWLLLPGLQIRGVVGLDNSQNRNISYQPPQFNYQGVDRGDRSIFESNIQRINYDLSASYVFEAFEGFGVNAIAGMQAFDNRNQSSTLTSQTFPTELIREISSGDPTKASVAEGFSNFRDAGIFARVETNYMQQYYFSAGMRNDFASSLGDDAPSIFYPQVSAAVRLDRLDILPKDINLLKFRIAYGETGRLPTFTQSQALLWTSGSTPSGAGALLNNAGNSTIKPERIQELEFGFDWEVANAYGGEVTYYIQNASDAILNVPRPPSTGLGSTPFNVGSINGWGFEALFYATPLQTRDYQLDFNLVFNYADNEVQDIGDNEFLQDGFTRNFVIPGQRRSEFMAFRPIRPQFRTVQVNGQDAQVYNYSGGVIRDSVRTAIGASAPLYTGSFSTTFRFLKDFSLYGLVEWGLGGSLYNATGQFGSQPNFFNNKRFNELATLLGIAGSNLPADDPRRQAMYAPQLGVTPVSGLTPLTPGSAAYTAAAEEFMRLDPRGTVNVANYTEKADFLRIREISLRWDATSTLLDLLGNNSTVKSLSFAVSARNVALFTNYSGPEVEINANPGSAISQGQDFLTLMQARTVNFMLNVGF